MPERCQYTYAPSCIFIASINSQSLYDNRKHAKMVQKILDASAGARADSS